MALMHYKEKLFELLPQLYHVYDEDDGSLKAFLAAIGETLDDMERNIADFSDDSFIETCHEWVIPYIAQLIGAKLVESEGPLMRREAMNTIGWRKRKGNLEALQEMAAGITGWGVQAVEFFEQIGWSQHVNHVKADHLQSPDLRDHVALFHLDGAQNTILHSIDVRKADAKQGWFQIKNIGFFLSTVVLAHYERIPMKQDLVQTERFDFDWSEATIDLFDGSSRFPIAGIDDFGRRISGFGTGTSVDIFAGGILAATEENPLWTGSPSSSPPDALMLDLADKKGCLPVGWQVEEGQPLEYMVTPMVLYESGGKARLKELGRLDLTDPFLEYERFFDGSAKAKGRLVMRITPKTVGPGPFPAITFQLESKTAAMSVYTDSAADTKIGLYRDRGYFYLPEFCPEGTSPKDFVLDRYGSAYTYVHDGTRPVPADSDLFSFMKLARVTQGAIYPSRQLTASMKPWRMFYSLDKSRPLAIIDRGQFISALIDTAGFTVKVWNRDNSAGGGVVRLLLAAQVTSVAEKVQVSVTESHSVDGAGHLVISVHRPAPSMAVIPRMEVITTDERGKVVLAYLPQINHMEAAGAFFYVGDDGSTYRVNGEELPDGMMVPLAPDQGSDGAFNDDCLAGYSAGQIAPIEGSAPIRHRIPIRCCLEGDAAVSAGCLAIDPALGKARFPEEEIPSLPLTASFYHGLAASRGAGPYFHGWGNTEETGLIRVSKFCAPDDRRHLRPVKEGVLSDAPIFGNITDAVAEMKSRSSTFFPGKPWVIRIEDSQVYEGDIHIDFIPPCGLIIEAAEFTAPRIDGRIILDIADTFVIDGFTLRGLTVEGTARFKKGVIKEVEIRDCTFLSSLLVQKGIKGEEDRYAGLSIERSIVRGHIIVGGYKEIVARNCALDPTTVKMSLMARRSPATIERCTVTGKVRVKELEASESIFTAQLKAINPQKGCIRYSRINGVGDELPYTYRCIDDAVTFCSRILHRSDYLKLRRSCDQAALSCAENTGEIGMYHGANYALKERNLLIKCDEYMPAGLSPVLIDKEIPDETLYD